MGFSAGDLDIKSNLNKNILIGNVIIDEQHAHFIRLLEYLHDINEIYLFSFLDELKGYIIYHFETEEDLLLLANYPYLDEHMQEHYAFKLLLDMMDNRLDEGTLTVLEVRDVLLGWYLYHMSIADLKYKEYIRNL